MAFNCLLAQDISGKVEVIEALVTVVCKHMYSHLVLGF